MFELSVAEPHSVSWWPLARVRGRMRLNELAPVGVGAAAQTNLNSLMASPNGMEYFYPLVGSPSRRRKCRFGGQYRLILPPSPATGNAGASIFRKVLF